MNIIIIKITNIATIPPKLCHGSSAFNLVWPQFLAKTVHCLSPQIFMHFLELSNSLIRKVCTFGFKCDL